MTGTGSNTIRSRLLQRKQVAAELGITRGTLRKIEVTDRSFPAFWALSAGIEVITRQQLDAWVEQREEIGRIEVLSKNDHE